MPEPIDNLYFNWLCAKVLRVEVPTPSNSYWRLLKKLYTTEYVWFIAGDDNRAADGVELRWEFLNESGIRENENWLHWGCSVLEMLIAFSRRAEFNAGESVAFWFWHFLENLQLSDVNDSSDVSDRQIDDILYTFVWRGYDSNGNGGICPMEGPCADQRQVEIFYQFCDYLVNTDWPL